MFISIKDTSFSILFVLSTVFILSGCEGKSNKDEVIKALEETLSKSNIAINNSTTTILKSLEEKRNDLAYSQTRSIKWFERAEKIAEKSIQLYNFISEAKKNVGKKAFSTTILHEKLVMYKQDVLSSDSAILEQFNTEFKFVDSFSLSSYPNELLSRLSILQNNIKINENKIIAFCNSKVGIMGDWFTSYSAIVGQNSTILKPGDELEIRAGIGLFSYTAQPKININGTNIELGDEGYSLFKTKVQKIPGKYQIPVTISFLNKATGKEENMRVNVEYTVAKECN